MPLSEEKNPLMRQHEGASPALVSSVVGGDGDLRVSITTSNFIMVEGILQDEVTAKMESKLHLESAVGIESTLRDEAASKFGSKLRSEVALDLESNFQDETAVNLESRLQDEVSTKFQPKKEMSLLLADVYHELDMMNRAFRVAGCGTFLEYHVTEQEKKLHTANFCKDRLCPMCNWRRSLKIFGQVSRVMNELEKQDYQFLFLTLTVKNCSAVDLSDTVQVLFDGWRKLYHKNGIFKRSIAGTFRSLEVTRNSKTGFFHPHLHVILAVRPSYFHKGYISQAEWSSLWRSCCNLDYTPVIDVRKIKPGSNGLTGAVAEVSKYAVKATDFLKGSMDDMADYVSAFLSALTGRRLCSFTGCFDKVRKQLALDDVESGDLVHVEADELRADLAYMVVRYCWRSGMYVRG